MNSLPPGAGDAVRIEAVQDLIEQPAARDGGATEILLADVPSLRSDVDTPDDLHNAISLGVGPRTAELAAQLS